jgi:hypothetical protein
MNYQLKWNIPKKTLCLLIARRFSYRVSELGVIRFSNNALIVMQSLHFTAVSLTKNVEPKTNAVSIYFYKHCVQYIVCL